jgi:hypothetical protein
MTVIVTFALRLVNSDQIIRNDVDYGLQARRSCPSALPRASFGTAMTAYPRHRRFP